MARVIKNQRTHTHTSCSATKETPASTVVAMNNTTAPGYMEQKHTSGWQNEGRRLSPVRKQIHAQTDLAFVVLAAVADLPAILCDI